MRTLVAGFIVIAVAHGAVRSRAAACGLDELPRGVSPDAEAHDPQPAIVTRDDGVALCDMDVAGAGGDGALVWSEVGAAPTLAPGATLRVHGSPGRRSGWSTGAAAVGLVLVAVARGRRRSIAVI